MLMFVSRACASRKKQNDELVANAVERNRHSRHLADQTTGCQTTEFWRGPGSRELVHNYGWFRLVETSVRSNKAA